jgi:hypothetical protein
MIASAIVPPFRSQNAIALSPSGTATASYPRSARMSVRSARMPSSSSTTRTRARAG